MTPWSLKPAKLLPALAASREGKPHAAQAQPMSRDALAQDLIAGPASAMESGTLHAVTALDEAPMLVSPAGVPSPCGAPLPYKG